MNEKQRTALLGALTVVVLAVFAVTRLFNKGPVEDTSKVAKVDKGTTSPVTTAVAPHDLRGLSKLYQPVLDADPFRSRIFTGKRRGDGKGPGGGGGDTAPVNTDSFSIPGGVTLRLTGIIQDGSGSAALFEDRGTGRGIFVKKGDKYGDKVVADVTTSAVLFATVAAVDSKTKKLEFSDRWDVKVSDVPGLTTFAVATAPVASNTSSSGSGASNLPPLDPEKAKSVLEQLREKRKKSLGN